jgi:hypothetical protein
LGALPSDFEFWLQSGTFRPCIIINAPLKVHLGLEGVGWSPYSAYCIFGIATPLQTALRSKQVKDDIKFSVLQPCWVRLQEQYKKLRVFFTADGISIPAGYKFRLYATLCELYEGYHKQVLITWGKDDWPGCYKGPIGRIRYEPACDGVGFYQSDEDETAVFCHSLSTYGTYWVLMVIPDKKETPEEA